MLIAAISGLTLLASPQQTVQVAVDDPLLPEGKLVVMGAAREGEFYADAPSFERSDLPGLVRGTVVVVTADAAPMQVVRLWIDCNRREYQLSNGRRYDAAGRQVAETQWVPDQPILPGTAADRIAAAFCPTGAPLLSGLTEVADYRVALQLARAGAASTNTAPPT